MRHFVSAFAVRWMATAVVMAIFADVSHAWAPHLQSSPSPNRVLHTRSAATDAVKGGRCVAPRFAVQTDAEQKLKTNDQSPVPSKLESESELPSLLSVPVTSHISTTSSSWEELERALELVGITWSEWISPLGQGLLPPDNQNPVNWEQFWELSLKANSDYRGSKDILVAEQFTRYLERLGATYVKFGQALSSRPDIVPRSLAVALSKLQDDMDVVDSKTKEIDSVRLATADGARNVLRREYTSAMSLQLSLNSNSHSPEHEERPPFRNADELEAFLATLSEEPVAAASIGVVYSGILPESGQKVAIKIQRPNIKETVQKDAKLLRRAAQLIESIPSFRANNGENSKSKNPQKADRFVRTDVTGAVDEFMTRLEEELDYSREANNLELFGKLYSHKRNKDKDRVDELVNMPSDSDIRVVVPSVYKHLCTDKVLVMEWIDGVKLVDLQDESERGARETEETLELIRQGIDCTLSQLLETGILHADPHGGNLLKVASDDGTDAKRRNHNDNNNDISSSYMLGYIDFGLLSTIPSTVQDGLICAVCQLIFANNVTAVSELFGELQLLPAEILEDPVESAALANELTLAIGMVLVFPTDAETAIADAQGLPKIPTLRFDKLLDVLTRLVPRFSFQLPPYFLNNARALATLEGMAREVDPNFNILRNLYPYAISRIFSNPTDSPVVTGTLRSLIQTPTTGRIDIGKLRKLVKDASNYSGYSKLKVIKDVAKSKSGPGLVGRLVGEQTVGRLLWRRRRRRKKKQQMVLGGKKQGRRRKWLLDKLADLSRL